MQLKAGGLDHRNVGARIAVVTRDMQVYGEIASVRRDASGTVTKVFLTDNAEPLDLDNNQDVEIQISGSQNATIAIGNALTRIEKLLQGQTETNGRSKRAMA